MLTPVEFNELSLLEDLTQSQRSNLLEKTSTFTLKKDEVIFREGKEATHIYFLLEGKVTLQTSTIDDKPIVTDVLRPGDLLGWSALFEGAKLTTTAVCNSDVRLARIERDDFVGELLKHSDTGILVMMKAAETISRRLRESRSRLALYLSGSHEVLCRRACCVVFLPYGQKKGVEIVFHP